MTATRSGDQTSFDDLEPNVMLWVNQQCDAFEQHWESYGSLSEFFDSLQWEHHAAKPVLIEELLAIDVQQKTSRGMKVSADDYADIAPIIQGDRLTKIIQQTFHTHRLDATHLAKTNHSANALLPGQRLGDYTITRWVASGGMGEVYLAQHRLMNRLVAIKMMNHDVRQDLISQRRFLREVQSLARLSHPNILTAYDAREENGQMYLVTEWIDGLDLRQMIERDGRLLADQAVSIAMKIADGLHYAHSIGIIHRDVKPSNVLIARSGAVKVLDLGLSRLLLPSEPNAEASLTQSRWILGTASFIAPEQARNPLQADQRADVYGLGCTLFTMLSGQIPYPGNTPLDILVAQSAQPVPDVRVIAPEVDPQLSAIVQQMMAKEPEDRLSSMLEVMERLTAWQQRSEKTSVDSPSSLKIHRRSILLAIALCVAVAISWAVQPQRGLPLRATGDQQAGLHFNGQTSHAIVKPFTEQIATGSTIAVVLTPQSGSYPANVVTWSGDKIMVLFIDAEGRWGVGFYDGNDSHLQISNEPVQIGRTQSVVASLQGNDLSLSIDGAPVATTRRSYAMTATDATLCIGGMPSGFFPLDVGTRFFSGSIQQVLVASRMLPGLASPSTIDPTDEAVLASFDFTKPSGSPITDQSSRRWKASLIDCRWQ